MYAIHPYQNDHEKVDLREFFNSMTRNNHIIMIITFHLNSQQKTHMRYACNKLVNEAIYTN